MKQKLIITAICLLSVIFILLIYYCYTQYRQNKDIIVSTVELVDSTKIYRIDELEINLNPKKVRGLDMSFSGHYPRGTKGYDTFPPIVPQLINLEYLDFSWNKISDLTPIQHLQHLKTIILSKNQIVSFEGFKNFTDLEHINISGNQLLNLKGIEELQNLQSLDLLWNQNLTDLKGIEKLTKLEDLTIGDNNFESFPEEILHLKNLKRLSLDDLYFKSFPDTFYTIGLPIEIFQMKDMHGFDYSTNLPQFHKLKNLHELYLYWDSILELNIDFEKCENLETFGYWYHKKPDTSDLKFYTGKASMEHYSYIDITDVLTRIAKAPKLKRLFLEYNNIQYLPKNLVLPDSLEELNLSYNNIKKLPVKIAEYTNLKKVDLRDNPIDTITIKKIGKAMVNTKFYYDK